LLLHCYQVLGSVADAEDMLQETLLAAWRGLERFEGRSSLRTWLHRNRRGVSDKLITGTTHNRPNGHEGHCVPFGSHSAHKGTQ